MISFLKGFIADVEEDSLILDVNHVGYQIIMGANDLMKCSGIGDEITVYTYLSVNESNVFLYGLLTKEALSLFKLLITVSGVGPKGALGLLNAFSCEDIIMAILSEDAKTLSKAPGVGAKTAQRIIIDLKGKVNPEMLGIAASAEASESSPMAAVISEAAQALVSLGFSNSEAMRAVKSVDANADITSEELLKLALKKLY